MSTLAATVTRPLDKWIFWTSAGNGWKWSVWRGAKVISEGLCRSEAEANVAADAAIAAA